VQDLDHKEMVQGDLETRNTKDIGEHTPAYYQLAGNTKVIDEHDDRDDAHGSGGQRGEKCV
jgi:hypothetical protein